MIRPIAGAVLAVSVGLFAIAMTQDAYYIDAEDPAAWASSWILLTAGWVGIFDGVFAWLANPLIAMAWGFYLARKHRAGAWSAAAATILALSFLMHAQIISSSAPTYSTITGYGLGYWLWIASAASVLVANLVAQAGARFNQTRLDQAVK